MFSKQDFHSSGDNNVRILSLISKTVRYIISLITSFDLIVTNLFLFSAIKIRWIDVLTLQFGWLFRCSSSPDPEPWGTTESFKLSGIVNKRNKSTRPEVRIYKIKILREKVRKYAFDQDKKKAPKKKKENTILTKKTRKKTWSWPRKQERKHDLDEENK